MPEEILNLVRPNLSAPIANASISAFVNSPLCVNIQSPTLLSILESSLRAQDNNRSIGALLGTRSSDGSVITIHETYFIPHQEKDEEVTIDEYVHKRYTQLFKTSNPKLSVVGWYQTSDKLDVVTGLIHEFFSSSEGTYPYSAIHLTLQTRDVNNNAIAPIINTYVSVPIASSGQTSAAAILAGNSESGTDHIFAPIPHEIIYNSTEVLALNQAFKSLDTNSTPLGKSYNDLVKISENLNKVTQLLDANITYVEKIITGETVINDQVDQIGKFLISQLLFFSSNYKTFNDDFNNFVQDTLMIEYLVSSIKTQIELSAKLTTKV